MVDDGYCNPDDGDGVFFVEDGHHHLVSQMSERRTQKKAERPTTLTRVFIVLFFLAVR